MVTLFVNGLNIQIKGTDCQKEYSSKLLVSAAYSGYTLRSPKCTEYQVAIKCSLLKVHFNSKENDRLKVDGRRHTM